MNAHEKITWMTVLLFMWGFGLFALGLVSILREPGAAAGLPVIAWIVVAATLAYLLVLSWRAAYLSGRNDR